MLKVSKFKKLLSVFLSFCLMSVSIVGFAPFTAKAYTPDVQLFYAKVLVVYVLEDGLYVAKHCVDGYVSANTGGSDKAVTCHYSQNDGAWEDVSAEYLREDGSGNEVWHFQTPLTTLGTGQTWDFAIKYDIDGSTYWDNNGGSNYNLWVTPGNPSSVCFVLNKSPLIQDTATCDYTNFSGSIVLKNFAYTKVVKIRYTQDNWATYQEADATYYGSLPNNLERWDFSISKIYRTAVEYAISYTVNGNTYWDNNFGENYYLY